jgi:hypothetical protein
MALITDPDLLADSALDDGSTEVYINTSLKQIKLVQTGDLSTDGVTLKCLYSFLKEEWKDDPNTKNLAAFPFPMVPITDESFEFVDGWDFDATATEQLIRTAGWRVRNTAGNEIKRFAGVVILGSVEANDQLYYDLGVLDPTGATNFALTGAINQAVQIIDDPNGDGNYVDGFDRTDGLTIYLREQGQLYDSVTNVDIGVTALDSIAYRFPLNTGADLNIDTVDTDIASGGSGAPDTAPYNGMSITYEDTTQLRTGFSQGGGSFNFGITVNANNNTLVDTYNFVQYMLRQTIDINAGTPTAVTGKLADELMYWVGPTLYTQRAYNPDIDALVGVFVNNIASADINSIIMVEDGNTEVSYPFTATLTLNFNNNLVNDVGPAKYWVYYTTTPVVGRTGTDGAITTATTTFTSASAAFVANDVDALILIAGAGAAAADLVTRIVSITNGTTVEVETAASTTVSSANWEIFGGDWGERGGLLIEDTTPADVTGNIAGATQAISYDYDGNNQANLGAATDKAVTAVAIGLGTGQYVRATGTIERSTTNSITLVAPLERNYANP